MWRKEGKKEEAGQLLAEICGQFSKGFDASDLKDAKALLDELGWGATDQGRAIAIRAARVFGGERTHGTYSDLE